MDKVISVYWFVILAMIAAAVVIMTAAFYNAPYDVREVEARLLTNKIADCISKGGEVSNYVYGGVFKQEFSDKILEICGINLEVEDTFSETQYYINVRFYSANDPTTLIFGVEKGNLNYISSCNIQDDEEFKKLAQCYEGKFYAVKGSEQFLIKITTAVGKSIKNVK